MQGLRQVLIWIARLSCAHPKIVISVFVFAAFTGFAAMPLIKISTDLTSGVAQDSHVVKLAKECLQTFGELDSLIVVIQFPEPPGRDRLPFLSRLERFIAAMPGVRSARCQFLDTQNINQLEALLSNFLLGLNEKDREQIKDLFREQHVKDALRRTRNRLFLIQDPDLRRKILEDPLELGHFVSESMTRRLGAVSLNDMFLLIASPDSTVFLIQVKPTFPSSDVTNASLLVEKLRTSLSAEISRIVDETPGLSNYKGDINWWLTGKAAFHNESNEIFRQESFRIFIFSAGLVATLLWLIYRSFWSGVLLLLPIVAGIGPNYGLLWLVYDEVNPVVMGAAGVLFGLATDYGVHLWAGLNEELDRSSTLKEAVHRVYERAGPAVTLGAFTCVIAFLCMCFSNQPAMAQFGYVGAIGLVLTLCSTLFLFPALVSVVGLERKECFPRMRVSFVRVSRIFEKNPWTMVIVSICLIGAGVWSAMRVSGEKDMFKVFLARNMESTKVSDFISRKFKATFGQPVLVVFDVEDFEKGLEIQRSIDEILSDLMQRDKEVASSDSISYLRSPASLRSQNMEWLGELVKKWPHLYNDYSRLLEESDLSESSSSILLRSFSGLGRILKKLTSQTPESPFFREEESWYAAKIGGSYRFLTYVRYVHSITDPEELTAIDCKINEALRAVPAKVYVIGLRQAMNEILSTLLSELVKIAFYTVVCVLVFFTVVVRRPLAVLLSIIPMFGAFAVALGIMGILGMGLPFSVVGVAPLIFGLGMDNGVHVVLRTLSDNRGVRSALAHVTGPIIFTSLTNITGFVAMLASRLYALEFLGWAMIFGMTASVWFTLTLLPAILFLIENKTGKEVL